MRTVWSLLWIIFLAHQHGSREQNHDTSEGQETQIMQSTLIWRELFSSSHRMLNPAYISMHPFFKLSYHLCHMTLGLRIHSYSNKGMQNEIKSWQITISILLICQMEKVKYFPPLLSTTWIPAPLKRSLLFLDTAYS